MYVSYIDLGLPVLESKAGADTGPAHVQAMDGGSGRASSAIICLKYSVAFKSYQTFMDRTLLFKRPPKEDLNIYIYIHVHTLLSNPK